MITSPRDTPPRQHVYRHLSRARYAATTFILRVITPTRRRLTRAIAETGAGVVGGER